MAIETRMKYRLVSFIKHFACGLLFMILLTYALGWYDIVSNNWLTGNWLKDFYKSITYYLGWVLVYWWVFILAGGLLIGIVTTGAFALVRASSIGGESMFFFFNTTSGTSSSSSGKKTDSIYHPHKFHGQE